ncbi:hypothetical protein ACTXT7_007044 [Hymenolepis weldensis]
MEIEVLSRIVGMDVEDCRDLEEVADLFNCIRTSSRRLETDKQDMTEEGAHLEMSTSKVPVPSSQMVTRNKCTKYPPYYISDYKWCLPKK